MKNLIVRKTKIHPAYSNGNYHVVYSVWEPTSGPAGEHSTITTIDGKWYGRVGTRRLPADIDAIPVGEERWTAIGLHRELQHSLAYRAILSVYPQLEAAWDRGEMETTESATTKDEDTAVAL